MTILIITILYNFINRLMVQILFYPQMAIFIQCNFQEILLKIFKKLKIMLISIKWE
jgi:hypothetical protein